MPDSRGHAWKQALQRTPLVTTTPTQSNVTPLQTTNRGPQSLACRTRHSPQLSNHVAEAQDYSQPPKHGPTVSASLTKTRYNSFLHRLRCPPTMAPHVKVQQRHHTTCSPTWGIDPCSSSLTSWMLISRSVLGACVLPTCPGMVQFIRLS